MKGMYGELVLWLNEHGIANLLSYPTLKRLGYTLSVHSKDDFWQVTPPGEKHLGPTTIKFMEDEKGLLFKGVAKQGVVFVKTLVETIRGNYEGYTKN